jgi:hypothetical protein
MHLCQDARPPAPRPPSPGAPRASFDELVDMKNALVAPTLFTRGLCAAARLRSPPPPLNLSPLREALIMPSRALGISTLTDALIHLTRPRFYEGYNVFYAHLFGILAVLCCHFIPSRFYRAKPLGLFRLAIVSSRTVFPLAQPRLSFIDSPEIEVGARINSTESKRNLLYRSIMSLLSFKEGATPHFAPLEHRAEIYYGCFAASYTRLFIIV